MLLKAGSRFLIQTRHTRSRNHYIYRVESKTLSVSDAPGSVKAPEGIGDRSFQDCTPHPPGGIEVLLRCSGPRQSAGHVKQQVAVTFSRVAQCLRNLYK
jgi:hypothetical protein